MRPIHPGEILRREFLVRGLTVFALARPMGLSTMQLQAIIDGEEPVTPDIAGRLSRVFGTTARFWIHLQETYDTIMRR